MNIPVVEGYDQVVVDLLVVEENPVVDGFGQEVVGLFGLPVDPPVVDVE